MLNFFGRKKKDGDGSQPPPGGGGGGAGNGSGSGGDPPGGGKPSGGFEPDPEKANRWFQHARVAASTGNLPYALNLFASGLKLDPTNVPVHDEAYVTATRYFSGGGKPATRSDIKKVDGPGPVDRFVAAEFAWFHDLNNLSLALELLESSAKASQLEFALWFAPRLLTMMKRQQVKKKNHWVQAKDNLVKLQTWKEAFEAADIALSIDPGDGDLQNEIKTLQAQLAIERGGFNNPQSTFRSNIKDIDKQRMLEEQESLSGGADVEERNLNRARKDFEDNPMSPEAISKYAQLLKRRNTFEAENEGHNVYMIGFERLGEYRFRMAAGDIRIAQLTRRVEAAKARTDAQPDDLILKTEYEDLRRELLTLRSAEMRERIERYPTDRTIRMDLGRLEYELGNYEAAMDCFQRAKDELKFRVTASHLLGRCFAAENWHTEAIGEYREALQSMDASQRELELPIKYDLMLSLIEQARAERSHASAQEAFEICSAIVRTNIGYRDIKDKRKEIDALRKDLG